MLLDALLARAGETGERVPPLYAMAPCRYVFRLTETGDLEGDPSRPEDHDTSGGEGREHGERYLMPTIERGGLALKPRLLSDDPEWTFGSAPPSGDEARTARRHESYLDLLDRCAQKTRDPSVIAVQDFLRSEAGRAAGASALETGARIGFRVNGDLVTDRPAVQEFWWSANAPEGKAMECIGCGRMRTPLQSLKTMVKGVYGTHPSGGALISANKDTIESWGLRRSTIAPLCSECGEAAMRSLNEILGQDGQSVWVGGLTFAAWGADGWLDAAIDPAPGGDEDGDEDGDDMKPKPQPSSPSQILAQFRPSERIVAGEGAERIFAVALRGERGRVAVRDWVETTAKDAVARADAWFEWQKIVGARGEIPGERKAAPIGIRGLVLAAAPPQPQGEAKDRRDQLAAARSLMRSFLAGDPVPASLLARAVGRVRARRDVFRIHAALIKLVLRSQHGMREQEDNLVTLNADSESAAYHCGRLLAVLDQLQQRAIETDGRTISDKHIVRAMSMPGAAFPRLLGAAEHHFAKLRRSGKKANKKAGEGIRKKAEAIAEAIGGEFPQALPIEGQGEFVLGYYHQRAAERALRAQRAAARREDSGEDESAAEADG